MERWAIRAINDHVIQSEMSAGLGPTAYRVQASPKTNAVPCHAAAQCSREARAARSAGRDRVPSSARPRRPLYRRARILGSRHGLSARS